MIKIFKKTKTFYIKSQSEFSMTSRLSQRSKSCPRAHRCSRLRFQNPNTLRQEWNPSLKTAKQQGSSWIIERHPQSYFCPDDVPWWWKECVHCKEVKLWPFHWNQQDIAPLSVSEEGRTATFANIVFLFKHNLFLTYFRRTLRRVAVGTRWGRSCWGRRTATAATSSSRPLTRRLSRR